MRANAPARQRQRPAERAARRRHRLARQHLRRRLRQRPHRQVRAHRHVDQELGHHGRGNGQFARPYGVAVDALEQRLRRRLEQRAHPGVPDRAASWPLRPTGTGNGQFPQLRRVAVGAGASPGLGRRPVGQPHQRFDHSGAFQRRSAPRTRRWAASTSRPGIAIGRGTLRGRHRQPAHAAVHPVTGAYQQKIGRRGWGTPTRRLNWPRDITAEHRHRHALDGRHQERPASSSPPAATPPARRAGASAPAKTRKMHWPFAIASAGAGAIVADTFNNRVQRWINRHTSPPPGPVRPGC